MQKNVLVLQILQKAREMNDLDLQNEALVKSLIEPSLNELKAEQKSEIIAIINDLINAKENAKLSNK